MIQQHLEYFIKYYLKLGLKLTTIEKSNNDSTNPNLREQFGNYLKTPTQLIELESDLSIFDENSTIYGIGLSLENSKLICIDIDYCFSNIPFSKILEILGLPSNYEWVIQTGSKSGYHIIVNVNNTNINELYIDLMKFDDLFINYPELKEIRYENELYHFGDLINLLSIPTSEEFEENKFIDSNSKIKSFRINKKYQNAFEKIQLMNDKHSLLPPSYHKSGHQYTFYNEDLPISYPKYIDPTSIFGLIKEFCIDEEILHKLRNYDTKYSSTDFKTFYGSNLYLIIDFETTDLIRNTSYYNITEFPEIIQVAWIITDGKDILYSESSLNSDISTQIPTKITNLTGIDNKKCYELGRPIRVITDMLINDLENVSSIIAYNLDFDLKFLKSIFFRASRPYDLNSKKHICLMKYAFDNQYIIKGYDSDRWLKLSELFTIIFPNISYT